MAYLEQYSNFGRFFHKLGLLHCHQASGLLVSSYNGQMADRKAPGNPEGQVTSATKRNRLALIKSAQEVLAEIGPDATVEQFVAHAGVSPTTIYNHFYNKEALFKEALAQAWKEWIDWAHGGIPADESFETMIDVCRKLFRVAKTHPEFSRLISKSLVNPGFVIEAVQADALPSLKRVARLGKLNRAEFDKRTRMFSYCIAGILHGVHTTNELSPADADVSLGIALAIWNVSPENAKAIISRPLSTFL
jgi:AcrR family transcriptional regulator